MDSSAQAALEFGKHVAKQIAGPILIGTMLSVALYGLALPQYMTYWRSCRDDPLWIKALVIWTLLLMTPAACLSIFTAYYYCVLNFGDLEKLSIMHPSIPTVAILNMLVGVTTELFFANRIRKLTGSLIIPSIVLVLSLGQVVTSIMVVKKMVNLSFGNSGAFKKEWIAWQSLVAAADLVNATALTVYLNSRRTGRQHTDDLIDRIQRLAIQTGAVTVIVALLCLLTDVLSKTALAFTFAIPFGMSHILCFTASLNGRTVWGDMGKRSMNTTTSTPSANVMVSRTTRVQRDVELGDMTTPRSPHSPPGTVHRPVALDSDLYSFNGLADKRMYSVDSDAWNAKSADDKIGESPRRL